ncbi:coiled-coil domain-containing protein [Helicobacter burdigaliensis]|uniref:coiled-coil domain-containing protein n=1 Tax=Helicobacter burdigaliensis TaxID=2315334 RepID=UPI000EF68738|nr:hypothetical protein [Helicobacter burdigaliensis]
MEKQCNYQDIIEKYLKIFGKENLIVRLFDKNEFKEGDLLKDFVDAIGLEWSDNFIIPDAENESLDLMGMELLKGLNRVIPRFLSNYNLDPSRIEIQETIQKVFVGTNNEEMKFKMPLCSVKFLVDYFEESNEWVRKEFFPHKERLFPKKDLTNYKENYELKEMKPEYWDRIAEFIADIVKTKNQNITDKTNIIQNKDKVITKQTTQIESLQTTIKEKDQIIDSNINQINQLQNDIQEKSTQLNQIQSLNKTLSFQTKYGTATQRIKNQLSYKLGQAMISNSKSLLGYIRMPYVLSYIKETHQKEQELCKQSIAQNPNLKLPPLESYEDYKEAIKIKNHLTYKLGAALIKANNVRGGGAIFAYIGFLKEVRRLKREYREKQKNK